MALRNFTMCGLKGIWIGLSLALIGAGADAYSAQRGDDVTIVSSAPEDWKRARERPFESAALLLNVPTTAKDQTVLSEVLHLIPNYFPELKLNTLSRGLHSSVMYLDEMTFDELKEMISFFQGLSKESLEKYDLLRPVTMFDPKSAEFTVVGTRTRFLALKPHSEFVEWQLRFWTMIEEIGPKSLMARHKSHRGRGEANVSRHAVHMSLVQWGEQVGIPLNEQQVEELTQRMHRVFEQSVQTYRNRFGQDPESFRFSWKEMPLQLVQPPSSFTVGPLENLTIKATDSGRVSVSKVTRVRLAADGDSLGKVIEARTSDLLHEDVTRDLPEALPEYLGQKQVMTGIDEETFVESIKDQKVLEAYQRARTNLSPTWAPAAVPNSDPARENLLFVGTQVHPKLAAGKTFDVFDLTRQIGFHSIPEVSIGMSIYASSVREEIRNPSDVDMMINAIAWVPDAVEDFESARGHAARSIKKIIDQIRDLDRAGKIAITELRIGSDATMGHNSGDVFEDALNNPYLSRDDVHRGYYIDRFGKKWTLEDLIALGDFIKFKVDFFVDDKREPISLQLGAGFSWKKNVFHFNQNGMKGIQPNLRTAVYDGAESYAIAVSLAKPYAYHSVQKFPVLPRAIGELNQFVKQGKSTAPKFIKKVYNFFFLARLNELRLDEIFYQETARTLEKQGETAPPMDEVVKDLLRAINAPQLSTLNALKRNANDFREFNEMRHRFTVEQWKTRVRETHELLARLEHLLESPEIRLASLFRSKVDDRVNGFRKVFEPLARVDAESGIEGIVHPSSRKALIEFEDVLSELESVIVSEAIEGTSLPSRTRRFIETYVRNLPNYYYRYLKSRSQDASSRMNWNLLLMGLKKPEKKENEPRVVKSSKAKSLPAPAPVGCEGLFFRWSLS